MIRVTVLCLLVGAGAATSVGCGEKKPEPIVTPSAEQQKQLQELQQQRADEWSHTKKK